MRALLLLLLALPAALMAQGKQLRLDVNGEIGIDQQGAVYDYKINTILTPEVKDIVDRSVRQWKFEPVLRDGKAVYAKTGMYLTLTALPVGWRKLFEASSVDAAKRWKFQPADTAAGDSGELTMIVPISYSVGGPMISSAGWRQDSTTTNPIPWLSADKQKYDARGLKEGESLALDNPVRIKTSIAGTML